MSVEQNESIFFTQTKWKRIAQHKASFPTFQYKLGESGVRQEHEELC